MSDRVDIGGSTLELAVGDITALEVDAIVNAANAQLGGGGGVDGAIHAAGGPEIMAETRRRYPTGCATGSAVISGAGNLPAQWVIHAVGPIYRGGAHGEEDALRSAYRRALELAREAGAGSVAFPAISAGVYGYPLGEAARVAVTEARAFLEATPDAALRVVFCLFSEDVHSAFAGALGSLDL